MLPIDGPPPAEPAVPSASGDPPGPTSPAAGPSAGRFAELLEGVAPLERVERLQVLETLSYGTLYEGRVFRASRAEPVALLEIDPALEQTASGHPPIIRTMLAASRLRGKHVLSPRALYRDGDSLYALFDAHPGLSLATGFDYLSRSGLKLSSEAVLRIASAALHALDDLDRQEPGAAKNLRCHGMLVPENFLVTEDQRVLVRGVGLWQAEIGRTGLLGPREKRYFAPMQTSEGAASPRHDLISLGTILFEAAAGIPAFDTAPSEEDVVELCARIEEMRGAADASQRDLLGLSLACLNTLAVTPASSSRLRISVDTMFLREAARARVPGILSLEELAGRVKAARPAIVKAVALSLDPVEPARPAGPPAAPSLPPAPPREPATPALSTAPAPALLPTRAAGPAANAAIALRRFFATPARRMGGLGAAAILAVAAWLVFARSGGRGTAEPDRTGLGRDGADPAAGASATYAAPDPRGPAVSVLPPDPVPEPTPGPAEAEASRQSVPGAAGAEIDRRKSRPSPARPPARASRPAAEGSAPPPSAEASLPVVAPGSLVEPGAPGYVAPVVVERPDDPRFAERDPRPPSPGSVTLDVLVDEHGRAVDHRIVVATRFPPGIAPGIARYLAAIRFRPAEVRGVPVRVWVRHEMRFIAP